LLIQPSQIIGGGKIQKGKRTIFAYLNLSVLASLIPQEFQFDIEEYFGNLPFGDPADFIVISFIIPQAPWAYQIGDEFPRRGKKVGQRVYPLRFKIFYRKIATSFSRLNFSPRNGCAFKCDFL
jgi:hypothetical protein